MNFLEVAGFVTGAIGVYLTIRENIWCFPIGLIYVIISAFLYFEQKLFADTLQQLVYIPLLGYGWWKWVNGENKSSIHISRTSWRLGIILFLITSSVAILLGWFLHTKTNATFPWLDSTATAISFTAQWMIAKKKTENWYLWIIVNIIYIGIYINKNLDLYSVLYFVYLLLAIWGLMKWLKEEKSMVSEITK